MNFCRVQNYWVCLAVNYMEQEFLKYLSLRQLSQEGDAIELEKKITFCFRVMSPCFTDPTRAEENFQILHQLKDSNTWKHFASFLDLNTNYPKDCSLHLRHHTNIKVILWFSLFFIQFSCMNLESLSRCGLIVV